MRGEGNNKKEGEKCSLALKKPPFINKEIAEIGINYAEQFCLVVIMQTETHI